MIAPKFLLALALSFIAANATAHAAIDSSAPRFVRIAAKNQAERSALADLGISIEVVRSDSVWSISAPAMVEAVKSAGFTILESYDAQEAFSGPGSLDFPSADQRYHNYAEMTSALRTLQSKHADITRIVSIGKSIEQRDIWAMQINSNPDALRDSVSGKPGAVFMGAHHAREHLTVELPLMLAQHLLANRELPEVARLLDTRDIWIIPMVNPDGAEFDVSTGKYQLWRKNRRKNANDSFGVDLNRNYGYRWGTGGSSKLPQSDTYRGEAAFSEPESMAVKNFVEARPNLKTMLTFHSFSELILYPWGHTNEEIGNARDLAAFKQMANTMAGWNKYRAKQSSGLYITSGDTTDWAYGEHGIFAFTFELSPSGGAGASKGFYPGAAAVDKAFADNLKPSLYLIDLADDPYRAADYVPLH
ncbi:MAG: hypothetical protein A2X94_14805 [Bdellovibrionales bacterium GWB1_55_8]|nr:MAG: hypothetical protein A2X94_14805 [Bdellovibrionales bacterium GWB1_55_8]